MLLVSYIKLSRKVGPSLASRSIEKPHRGVLHNVTASLQLTTKRPSLSAMFEREIGKFCNMDTFLTAGA